jgi:hypothetical protein
LKKYPPPGFLHGRQGKQDFLPSELWAIAKKVKEIVRTPAGRPSEKVENFHLFNGKTRDKAAAPGEDRGRARSRWTSARN